MSYITNQQLIYYTNVIFSDLRVGYKSGEYYPGFEVYNNLYISPMNRDYNEGLTDSYVYECMRRFDRNVH